MKTQNYAGFPALKVSADPEHAGKHPLHDSRYVMTDDAQWELRHGLSGDTWMLESGSVVCQMTDCENQKELAALFAAAPRMLDALVRLQNAPNDPREHRRALDAINAARGEVVRDSGLDAPPADSAANGPQLCDCGAVAQWNGDTRGLREFCCEACWLVSAGNPERVAVSGSIMRAEDHCMRSSCAVLVLVVNESGGLVSADIEWSDHPGKRPDVAEGWKVVAVPVSRVLAARSLQCCVVGLLACCELNLDDMEEDTRREIEWAEDLLGGLPAVDLDAIEGGKA